MRYWSTEDLVLLAICTLQSDNKITKYIMLGDVEYRQPGNPFVQILQAMDSAIDSFDKLNKVWPELAEAFRKFHVR